MAYIISERSFEKSLTDADLEDMMARTAPCLEDYGARWIRSYLSNTRQRMICAFEAPDAESVRTALRVSGMAFERVWQGDELGPERD
ncbi:MAG: DUF4242 domain-containing protein [Nitrococcus sp.]|nr:DUF4242 domain-containing protein [Nitrococcus sp.]